MLVGAIADEVAKQLAADGLEGETVEKIRYLTYETVSSVATGNFQEYDSLLRAFGVSLNERRAKALADHYRKFGFSTVSDERWATMTDRERIAYIWEHLALRGAGWQAVDLDSVRAWQGWAKPALEGGTNMSGQQSMYASIAIEVVSQPGFDPTSTAAESVWIQFPVDFEVGGMLNVLIQYVRVSPEYPWMPVRIETIGMGRRPALLF